MNPLLLGPLFEIGKSIIDRVLPDPEKKAAAEMEWYKAVSSQETQERLAQIGVNKAEAEQGGMKAAWRPAIGFVIAGALAFQYIVNPMFLWVAAIVGSDITPPAIGLDDHLWELMFGMLGLAGWRTMDKIKGKE